MANPPDLHIPPSTATVNVSLIDTGATLKGLRSSMFVEPEIPGHEYLAAPCSSFLIENPARQRMLLFDLGLKKDWETWPKPLRERLSQMKVTPFVPKDVREVLLDAQGFDTKAIEGAMLSHTHVGHVGDVSALLGPRARLVVGIGTRADVFPGYPARPAAHFAAADVAGREVEEMDFDCSFFRIGGLTAIDYFADGSFYLLGAPGHCIGHMCGLARVTSDPDSFVLMGGGALHHGGELRPHPWRPLPESILPNPFDPLSSNPCPGELFDQLLPNGRKSPFYQPSRKPDSVHSDVPAMVETIRRLQEFDAHDNILIVLGHDPAFLSVADRFPKTLNAFMEKDWAKKTRWAWLADFAKAAHQDERFPRRDTRPGHANKS
ncbi:hypothetical protein F4802DRAFT_600652 [Xylaria palmicola]|nr:hypothetical protein F4802DRAFT_600652 [Xylaria palmicola]